MKRDWFFLLLIVVAAALADESLARLRARQGLFDAALGRLSTNVRQLEQLLVGSVILYDGITECPPPLIPADNYEGKLFVVGRHEIGRTSAHSLHSESVYAFNSTCETFLDVGEMGFKKVCKGCHDYVIALKHAIPTTSVLACVWGDSIVYDPDP